MTYKVRVDKRVVGVVIGKNFIKKARGSKHFLRIPPAIAFSLQSLRDAYNAGARYAVVIDKETQIEYFSTIANIYANGFDVNRGHGAQIALPIPSWRTIVPPITEWANEPIEAIYLKEEKEEKKQNAS